MATCIFLCWLSGSSLNLSDSDILVNLHLPLLLGKPLLSIKDHRFCVDLRLPLLLEVPCISITKYLPTSTFAGNTFHSSRVDVWSTYIYLCWQYFS